MAYYKSKRFVDRLKWVIVDENGKVVNRNPSKEELKGLEREQKERYVKKDEMYIHGKCRVDHTNTACIFCRSTKTSRWLKYEDDKGNWDKKSYECNSCYRKIKRYGTANDSDIQKIKNEYKQRIIKKCCECGSVVTYICENDPYQRESWHKHECDKTDCSKYLCTKCYAIDYQANNPNSQRNMRKCLANIRTGNVNIEGNNYKGLIGELTVCKTLGVKSRNIENNKFNSYVDTFYHEKYGEIEVKTKCPSSDYNNWHINITEDDKFDTAIILCMDKDMKNVKRSYAIPHNEIGSGGITISSIRGEKWEKFRIDEKPFMDTYQNLLEYFKDKRFSLENIRKWLYADGIMRKDKSC